VLAAGAWRGQTLSAETGERFTVIYQGRRGEGAGPDFRDAVLAGPDGSPLGGDVELHLRAAGWQAHGHAADPRYNGLVLHVTLGAALGVRATRLASGREVPLVVLRPHADLPIAPPAPSAPWPCAGLATRIAPDRLRGLLEAAGLARFQLRAEALAHELRASTDLPTGDVAPSWNAADRVLFTHMAEALAYGRDWEALRAAGERTATFGVLADDGTDALPGIERQRLDGLLRLYALLRHWAMGAAPRDAARGDASGGWGERSSRRCGCLVARSRQAGRPLWARMWYSRSPPSSGPRMTTLIWWPALRRCMPRCRGCRPMPSRGCWHATSACSGCHTAR
jgi:hypothetical protein